MEVIKKITAFINHYEAYEVSGLSLILSIFAGICVVVASGFRLYTIIRPRFPIKVNCWFCNKNTDVEFAKRNSWNCLHCEQYNGFLQDGGYNRIIPAQSDELLNHPITAVKRKAFKTDDNGLCRKCNINQELKVQQLASFTPIDNTHFDDEVELYRQRLERAYQLCEQCESKTNNKLRLIKVWLKKFYNSQAHQVNNLSKNKQNTRKETVLQFVSIVCSAMSVLASIGVSVALFARFQPLLELEVRGELQPLFAESLKWETVMELSATVFMALCLFTGSRWIAPELIPITLWGMATYCSYEGNLAEPLLNQQLLANAQASLIPTALLTTIWAHMKHYKTPEKVYTKLNHATRMMTPVISPRRSEFSDEEDLSNAELPKETGKIHNMPDNQIPTPLILPTGVAPSKQLDPTDLQSGLNDLSLGPLLHSKTPSPSLFEHRIYQAPQLPGFSSNVSTASNMTFEEGLDGNWGPCRRKPVLSPARLHLNNVTHSSWVAGGYWQNNVFPSPPPSFYNSFSPSNFALSRSSSQSSGFASQGGTNFSSLPNSRSGSICEADRFSVLSEPTYPSYSPPLAPYCCYVATPHPAFYFPQIAATPSLVPPISSPTVPTNQPETQSPPVCATPVSAKRKSLGSLIRENYVLATLFFSSIVFNAVVIAFAALNTFQIH